MESQGRNQSSSAIFDEGVLFAHRRLRMGTPVADLSGQDLFWLVCTIRYDTVDLRALKSRRDGQLNLAHGTETKNNEKIKIKNRVAQKIRYRQKSVEAAREEEVQLRGVGFVKEVGFKPGVKERWSYRCTKW